MRRERWRVWLWQLVLFTPVLLAQPPITAEPRTDLNSRQVHAELLAKKQQGRIDIYFEGDSITRRWGTSDAEFKDMLANWQHNFHGWNAADFGWGGDTVQNILWRLQQGELTGVNPKVIVLMAGTNNLSEGLSPAQQQLKVQEVVSGIRMIVDLMQQQAPGATLILTGITPRKDKNGGTDYMPLINAINAQLATFADGKRIRYININNQLVDANGKVLDGMTVDGLHPSVRSYQFWADALKPLFTELLGPPARVDLAPPPSSNPAARRLVFEPFHKNGLYAAGEQAGWTLHAPQDLGYKQYRYEIRENNFKVLQSGAIDVSSGTATLSTSLSHPGMLYTRLQAIGAPEPQVPPTPQELDKLTVGAAVAPALIQPPRPKPADFDSFWAAKLAALQQVPVNAQLATTSSGQPGINLYSVTLDSVNSQVHGYLATPTLGGRHPALVIFQYAGVYPLQKSWATERAAEGWLVLDVSAHDMLPDQATAPRNYAVIGNTNRETSYFLNMYLRDTRALDYIESRADWDGKTLVLMGTSMGGQQALVTAGLNPQRVTALIVNVPAGTDFSGDLHGSKRGYPDWSVDDATVVETARYFDAMNFAPAIRAKAVVALGFIDTTSPPYGIFATFNQIKGKKEVIPMVDSDHNHITPQLQGAYEQRLTVVLEALRKTGDFQVNSGPP